MNDYLSPGSFGVEIGCGAGFSREFIRCGRLLLTDFTDHDFLDVGGVDALRLPFANESFDFAIAANVMHHLHAPVLFLRESRRIIRRGGVLLIQDVHASVLCRLMLRMMRHEGYSFDTDVFDENFICTDPNDLWAGNNAICRLLFDDHDAFLRSETGWRILRDQPSECLMFLNSGGVTAKTAYIPLPHFALKAVSAFDRILSKAAPDFFAFGRRIALQRTD